MSSISTVLVECAAAGATLFLAVAKPITGVPRTPILFIMGTGGSHKAWVHQSKHFALERPVITYDNRGTGCTKNSYPVKMEELVNDVEMVRKTALESLKLPKTTPVHIAGLSLGGIIAQYYTSRFPEAVKSLQLHSTLAVSNVVSDATVEEFTSKVIPTCYDGRSDAEAWGEYNDRLFPIICPRSLARNSFLSEQWKLAALKEKFPPTREGLLSHWKLDKEVHTLSALKNIPPHIPILVTGDPQDQLVPYELTEFLHSALVELNLNVGTLVQVEEGGHLSNIFAVESFNAIVERFLKSTEIPSSRL